MTKLKIQFLFVALSFFSCLSVFAQSEESVATNPTANYEAKPKNMWELGVHGGIFQIAGDVTPVATPGVGLHLRKSLGYTFSLRFNAMVGYARGFNVYGNTYSADSYTALEAGYGAENPWLANFHTDYSEGSVQGVISLGNLLFHEKRNRWDLFAIAGLGLNYYRTYWDAFDGDGNAYQFQTDLAAKGLYSPSNNGERKDTRQEIRNEILDKDGGFTHKGFETSAAQRSGIFDFITDDENNGSNGGKINPIANLGMGIGYLVNDRISLTLEHQVTFTDDDYLDGYAFDDDKGGNVDETENNDYPQYTSLHVNFHLGKKGKAVIPLWWTNPLEAPLAKLDDVKKKVDDLGDEDGDGVLDLVDAEADSPADCPVDTRGVTLDSDQDGIPDCKDKEPFSPPGYPIDEDGVAQYEDPDFATKGYVDGKVDPLAARLDKPAPSTGVADWFLPMIHFDLDKYYIKPEFIPQLKHIATVMQKYPNLTVVATGHTDVRMPNDYNLGLAYNRANSAINYLVTNYGIDRSRLLLQYKGEESPMVGGLPDNHAGTNYDREKMQYMNRRVEFTIANGSETNMGSPAKSNVGKNTPRSSRGGKIYSGNPGSGY